MKSTLSLLVVLLLGSASALQLRGEVPIADKLNVAADLRYGLNYINDITDNLPYTDHDLRTRMLFNLRPGEKERGRIELSDWRTLGGSSSGSGIQLLQATMTVDDCLFKNFGGNIGRMRYVVGNERIIGDDDWYEGRAFDGAAFYLGDVEVFRQNDPTLSAQYGYGDYGGIITYHRLRREEAATTKMKDRGITGEFLAFKIDENDSFEDDDHDFMGVNLHLPKYGLMPFIYYDRMNNWVGNHRRLHLYTPGVYFNQIFGNGTKYVLEGNGAFQTGKARIAPGDANELDLSAYLIQADFGAYFMNYERPLMVGGGIDITSGDDDFNDNDRNVWTNQLYSPHLFRGLVDYFTEQPPVGFNDFYGRIGYFPSDEVQIGFDAHLFRSNKEFQSATNFDEDTKSVGTEFDFYGSARLHENIDYRFELGIFKPSEEFAGEDANSHLRGVFRIRYRL